MAEKSKDRQKTCRTIRKAVLTREVLIDFLHFQDNIIRDACFSQQHVELTGHTAGNGMNTEPAKNTDLKSEREVAEEELKLTELSRG